MKYSLSLCPILFSIHHYGRSPPAGKTYKAICEDFATGPKILLQVVTYFKQKRYM